MPYTIPRGQKRDSQFYQSFNGLVGECFESIAKLAVCWQFCGQLAPGVSQHTYAKAYKLEPVVGLGLVACPSCSSRQLCRLRNLHQFALNFCDNTPPEKNFNRSLKERSPSAQWTFREMILSFGARFGARSYREKSFRTGSFCRITLFAESLEWPSQV